jgi:hypothetical protein
MVQLILGYLPLRPAAWSGRYWDIYPWDLRHGPADAVVFTPETCGMVRQVLGKLPLRPNLIKWRWEVLSSKDHLTKLDLSRSGMVEYAFLGTCSAGFQSFSFNFALAIKILQETT